MKDPKFKKKTFILPKQISMCFSPTNHIEVDWRVFHHNTKCSNIYVKQITSTYLHVTQAILRFEAPFSLGKLMGKMYYVWFKTNT